MRTRGWGLEARDWQLCLCFVLAGFAVFSPSHADFTLGPLAFSGNVQTQQIFRHPDVDKWSIIQQRNVVRVRLEYDWISEGQAFGTSPFPGFGVHISWRCIAASDDSVYDFQPGPRQESSLIVVVLDVTENSPT